MATGESLLSASTSTKCYVTGHVALQSKGVDRVVDCVLLEPLHVTGIEQLGLYVEAVSKALFAELGGFNVSFESNEPIGLGYMLYRYHINLYGGVYIGVRVVSRRRVATRILFTIPRGANLELKTHTLIYKPEDDLTSNTKPGSDAPGQVYIEYPVVYGVLGIPRIDASKWSLVVEGEVDKPLILGLSDLYEMGVEHVAIDFHCVTGWSVKNVEFAGVRLSKLLEKSEPKDTAKWVYVESLDGYSTVFPASEVFESFSLIALEMNGKPLELVHGYPARLVIPHLYGWKSAKWIYRISLLSEYRDGYWEALGYHPRGRVRFEERFKSN